MDLEALLRAVRDGEPGAWKALYPRLSRELRVHFLREFDESSAVELTQRTMEALTRQLPGFVPRESLRQWVFGIARNQGRLEHQHRAHDRGLSELAARIVQTPKTTPTERLHVKELIAVLREEINRLPNHLRRVIENDLEFGDAAEFAKREGIELATVRTRRFRALRLLRSRLSARLNLALPVVPTVLEDSTSSSSSSPNSPA